MKTALQCAALGAVMALAGHASAASLGMNWVNNSNGGVQNGNGDSMISTDVAGAPGFAQANWNNLGRWGDNVNLVDSTGAASGVLVAWDSTGVWNNGASTATGDGKMMNGYIDSNGSANTTLASTIYGNSGNNKPLVFFSGISAFLTAQGACNYDVVIYVSGDTAGRVGEYWLVAASGSASSGNNVLTYGSNLTTPVFLKAPAPFSGTYTQVPLTSTAGATAATGNYVVFTNLTADSFLLRTEEYNTRSPINGIQIWPHLAGAPVIGSTASAQTNYGGQTINLTVSATACTAPTYQWQAGAIGSGLFTNVPNGGTISGATSSTLTISNAAVANSADYQVIASNGGGSATSAVMTVTVVPALITTQPTPATEVLFPGATAHFRATVQATAPTLTWRKAGVALSEGGRISGSATNILNISNVGAGDDVSYDLVVTTAYGSVTSSVATLSLLAAPAAGSFAESVITNNALAYWRFSESAGPTAFDSAGGFNGTFLASSLPAQTGPQPPDFLGFENSNTGVGVNSGGVIADQSWVTVPGLNMVTNAITIVAWVNPVQNQQAWTGILMTRSGISGGMGFSGTANELAYTWNGDTTWIYHSGLIVPNGQWSMVAMVMSASSTVLYVGNTNSGLISWSNPLTNAVQNWTGSGMIGDDQNGTGRAYAGLIDDVAVFNHALSPAAILSLYAAGRAAGVLPPAITAEPAPLQLYPGRTASFSVTASGTAPLAYRWRKNGVTLPNGGNVSGATTAALTLTGVAAGDVAGYDVVVTNNAGSVASSVAALTLVAPTGGAYEAAVMAANPYAYWRLNEASGSTNAFDSFGGHTAIYGAYAAPGASGPVNTEYTGFESVNNAVQLTQNLPESWVSVPPLNLNTNTVTITAWIYPYSNNQTNSAIFFQRQGLTVAGLTYDNIDGTKLGYNWNDATFNFASGLSIAPNQWSFVAMVVEPTKATLYLYTTNTQFAAANVQTHVNQGFAGTSYIGHDTYSPAGARIFNGVIDETAVWNSALTSEQIAALYTAASGAHFAPKITVQPVSQSLYAGLNAQLTASAAGSATLTYHWQKNGAPLSDGGTISGATTPTLNVTSATLGDAGDYALVVANSQGSVTSQVATLTFLPASARLVWSAPAVITTADATLNQSGSVVGAAVFGGVETLVTLSGGAVLDFKSDGSVASVAGSTGTGNLAFDPNTTGNLNFDATLNEFNHDGGPKTITLKSLIPGHQYSVQLFGLDNRANPPAYNEMSRRAYYQDAYDTNDNSATFYMSNNVYVMGTFTAAGTNQLLREILPGLDGGTAQVGNGNLNALVLRDLSPAPTVASQPVSLTRYVGAAASFTATAFGTPPMYYQWQKRTTGSFANYGAVGTINVSVITPVTLSIPSVSASDAADYRLVITNASGAVTSQVATLTVLTPASGSYAAAVLAGNPLAYYRLNETGNAGSGTLVAHDYRGGYDGLYGSAATNGVAGPSGVYFTGLEANNTAVETAGGVTNSWVTAPFGSLGLSTVTFTMWIYPMGGQANWSGLLVTRGGSGQDGGLNYNDQGMLGYTWNRNTTWGYASGLVIPSDTWSFIATVIEPTQATLYLYNSSGQLSATNAIAHTPDAFGGNWLIGADGTGGDRVFNGIIDEVAIYGSAFTAAQIGQLYQTGAQPLKITIQTVGSNVQLTWPLGTLLQADQPSGPWTTNSATSPYSLPPTAAKKFYKVIAH